MSINLRTSNLQLLGMQTFVYLGQPLKFEPLSGTRNWRVGYDDGIFTLFPQDLTLDHLEYDQVSRKITLIKDLDDDRTIQVVANSADFRYRDYVVKATHDNGKSDYSMVYVRLLGTDYSYRISVGREERDLDSITEFIQFALRSAKRLLSFSKQNAPAIMLKHEFDLLNTSLSRLPSDRVANTGIVLPVTACLSLEEIARLTDEFSAELNEPTVDVLAEIAVEVSGRGEASKATVSWKMSDGYDHLHVSVSDFVRQLPPSVQTALSHSGPLTGEAALVTADFVPEILMRLLDKMKCLKDYHELLMTNRDKFDEHLQGFDREASAMFLVPRTG